jgi:hypothetical protein
MERELNFGPVKLNMRIDQHSMELEGQQLSIMVQEH